MSRLLSFLLLLSIFVPAVAENYPYRNDYLWVTVPDHADWLYETGENATVDVQLLRYGVPAAGAVVTYTIGDDMLPDDRKDTVKLDKEGRATIAVGTMAKPGFRDLR
ncbi:MAG: acetylxylan esterase, partial [Duncaniella sp.]|nr:acetylxylan esterase [Duncaniella sp.]